MDRLRLGDYVTFPVVTFTSDQRDFMGTEAVGIYDGWLVDVLPAGYDVLHAMDDVDCFVAVLVPADDLRRVSRRVAGECWLSAGERVGLLKLYAWLSFGCDVASWEPGICFVGGLKRR